YRPPAHTEIYPLSLHDALPIFNHSYVENIQAIDQKQTKIVFSNNEYVIVDISYGSMVNQLQRTAQFRFSLENRMKQIHSEMKKKDRKSTRLNSSHVSISYAVFC